MAWCGLLQALLSPVRKGAAGSPFQPVQRGLSTGAAPLQQRCVTALRRQQRRGVSSHHLSWAGGLLVFNWMFCSGLLINVLMSERKVLKTAWRFFKIELPYDSSIPLLCINPKEVKARTQTDLCVLTFVAALFTIAKKWIQPKCL